MIPAFTNKKKITSNYSYNLWITMGMNISCKRIKDAVMTQKLKGKKGDRQKRCIHSFGGETRGKETL
jgi:hypothetical protein